MPLTQVAPSRRFDYPFLATAFGGLLICVDYSSIFVFYRDLSIDSLSFVFVAIALGVAMMVGAYLYKLTQARWCVYLVLATSLLSLFLAASVLSSFGAVLGSISAAYLLTKRRMQTFRT